MFIENRILMKKIDGIKREPFPLVEKIDEGRDIGISEDQLGEELVKLFEVDDSDSWDSTLSMAVVVQDILSLFNKRVDKGDKLVSVDGINWTWINKKGIKTSSLIPFVVERKEMLKPSFQKLVLEHEEKEAEIKRKALERRRLIKSIDRAGRYITDIYEKLLDEYSYDEILPLDQVSIDKYLKKGYTRILPLYDGIGKNVVGYVMENPKTKDQKTFELVVVRSGLRTTVVDGDDAVADDATKNFNDDTLKREQINSILNIKFPDEVIAFDSIKASLKSLPKPSDMTVGDYDDIAGSFEDLRGQISSDIPKLQELDSRFSDELTNIRQLLDNGMNEDEFTDYLSSLGVHDDFEAARVFLPDDSDEAAAFSLYADSIEGEFEALAQAYFKKDIF